MILQMWIITFNFHLVITVLSSFAIDQSHKVVTRTLLHRYRFLMRKKQPLSFQVKQNKGIKTMSKYYMFMSNLARQGKYVHMCAFRKTLRIIF